MLGDKIGAGNFGSVRKATTLQPDMIPPELHGKEVKCTLCIRMEGPHFSFNVYTERGKVYCLY